MSADEMKLIYNSLLTNGDLEVMFPSMIGDWIIDKAEFIIQYDSTERLLESLEEDDMDDMDDVGINNEFY
jgi:hypothetical protein